MHTQFFPLKLSLWHITASSTVPYQSLCCIRASMLSLHSTGPPPLLCSRCGCLFVFARSSFARAGLADGDEGADATYPSSPPA